MQRGAVTPLENEGGGSLLALFELALLGLELGEIQSIPFKRVPFSLRFDGGKRRFPTEAAAPRLRLLYDVQQLDGLDRNRMNIKHRSMGFKWGCKNKL